MADKWYYANEQEKLGPFSSAQLKELATIGQLVPTQIVWKEGIEKGALAAKVKNLFPAAQGKSPPPAAAEVSSSCLPAQAEGPVPAMAYESPPPSSPASAEDQGPTLQAGPDQDQRLRSQKAPKHNQPIAKGLFRVVGSSGAVVLSHDGTYVRYKKKCPKCGHEDSSVKAMAIRSGVNRDRFFCEKCRKLRQVEIHVAV
jgi:hypothetical protein